MSHTSANAMSMNRRDVVAGPTRRKDVSWVARNVCSIIVVVAADDDWVVSEEG